MFTINDSTKLPSSVVLIRILVHSHNQPCVVLMDTGASTSVISKSFAQHTRRLDNKVVIHGVGGNSTVDSYSNVDLNFCGAHFVHKCLVMPDLKYSIILGSDFLALNSVDILYSEQCIAINDIRIPFYRLLSEMPAEVQYSLVVNDDLFSPNNSASNQDSHLYVVKDTELPPFTLNELIISSPDRLTHNTIFKPEHNINRLGIFTQHLNGLKVYCYNFTPEPLMLCAKTRLGRTFEAEQLYSLTFKALEELDKDVDRKASSYTRMSPSQLQKLKTNSDLRHAQRQQLELVSEFSDLFFVRYR